MRRLLISLIVVAGALADAASAADAMQIPLNHAVRIRLAGDAESIVLGNDKILDVTTADSRSIVVIGKSAGSANVLVTGHSGRVLLDRSIRVVAMDAAVDTVDIVQGEASSWSTGQIKVVSYACQPVCKPVPAKK